jgi:hypothetical protein
MRTRLALFFDDLVLEELLYLQEELDRRKEKYRRNYAVLAVQSDRPVLRTENMADLERFHRDMRRFVTANAAVGGGTLLHFSPELSVIVFATVSGAAHTCSALLSGLPELHGRYHNPALRIGLKMGLASGHDLLAPGSARSVRSSALVKRATQSAWRGTAGTVLMDDNSYHEWPDKLAVEPLPFDLDGQHVYRAVPGTLGKVKAKYDDEALLRFLRQVVDAGIPTLKYDLEHMDHPDASEDALSDSVRVVFEAYHPETSHNLIFKEVIAVSDYGDRIEAVRRMLNSVGLALVRHEASIGMGA